MILTHHLSIIRVSMVDVLGRAGQLKEAEEFVNKIPGGGPGFCIAELARLSLSLVSCNLELVVVVKVGQVTFFLSENNALFCRSVTVTSEEGCEILHHGLMFFPFTFPLLALAN